MKVVKRDGSLEDFEKGKITKVASAAGLEDDKAKNIAETVAMWVKEQKAEKLSSQEIRGKVFEELKKNDARAADLYHWYEKTKDGNS